MDCVIPVSANSLIYTISRTERQVVGLSFLFKRISDRHDMDSIYARIVPLHMFVFVTALHRVSGSAPAQIHRGTLPVGDHPRYAHIWSPDCNQVCCFNVVEADSRDIFLLTGCRMLSKPIAWLGRYCEFDFNLIRIYLGVRLFVRSVLLPVICPCLLHSYL